MSQTDPPAIAPTFDMTRTLAAKLRDWFWSDQSLSTRKKHLLDDAAVALAAAVAEIERITALTASLADRVHAQAELLARQAERVEQR